MKVIFGVDVGGTSIKIGLFNEEEKLISKHTIKTNKESNGKFILSEIAEKIKGILKENSLKETNLLGVGFGLPGPVVNNFVSWCPNIGLRNTDIEKAFIEELGFQTIIKATNDATAAAYGEYAYAKKEKNVVFFTLGTGVGGGLVVNGNIVEGTHGAASEFGHIKVEYENPQKCPCGLSGCLETTASIKGIKWVAEETLKQAIEPTQLTVDDLSPRTIFYLAKKEDKVALDIVKKVGDYIARATAKVTAVVDPEVVLIGGGISNAGTILIKAIKDAYKKYCYFGNKDVKIRLAKLKNDAGMYGTSQLIFGMIKDESN